MFKSRYHIVWAVAIAAAVIGCNQAGESDDKASGDTANVNQVSIPADLNGKLAEADMLDGKADKHIHKCYSCALGMDGKEEYTAEVNGYEVCFCSEICLESFEKDAEKIVSDTKIPGTEKESDQSNQSDESDKDDSESTEG